MNHHRIAITTILLAQVAFFGAPTLANDPVTVDTVDTESAEWRECASLLRLSPSIAVKGTYRIRVVECVNQKLRNQEVGDIDREHRLTVRTRRVINAFRSGRLGATARSVGVQQPATEIEGNRVVPTTQFRRYRTVNTTSRTRSTDNSNFTRPSRRAIQSRAYSQSVADKKTESEIYQQRWKDALETCRDIENHFRRNNCIDSFLRQDGDRLTR